MTVLETIQADLVTRLQASSTLADVVVLAEDRGDFAQVLDQALASVSGQGGKAGAVIIVALAEATSESGDAAGAYFDRLIFSIRCVEQVVINRDPVNGTGKSALALANYVIAELANEQPETDEQPLFIEALRRLEPDPDAGLVGYEVEIRTAAGIARTGESA